jgi:hypothetical protein
MNSQLIKVQKVYNKKCKPRNIEHIQIIHAGETGQAILSSEAPLAAYGTSLS